MLQSEGPGMALFSCRAWRFDLQNLSTHLFAALGQMQGVIVPGFSSHDGAAGSAGGIFALAVITIIPKGWQAREAADSWDLPLHLFELLSCKSKRSTQLETCQSMVLPGMIHMIGQVPSFQE